MLDAFDVLMPGFKERVRGRVRPVLGARCGVLLLDGGTTRGSLHATLYDELELYLQAAGLTCLRVPGQPREGVARRARELLASVTQLRSIGVEQIILIIASDTPLPDPMQASSDTMADFLEVVVKQSQTMPALLRAVRSLIAGVRIVADSVIGVATLVPASTPNISGAPRLPRKRPPLRLMSSQVAAEGEADEAAEALKAFESAAALPALHRPTLLLALPPANDAQQPRRHVEALSRLYTWAMQVSGIKEAPAAFSSDHSVGAESNRWHATLARLEVRWDEILDARIRRKPELAATFRAFRRRRSQGNALSQARETWQYLDTEARLQWLAVCAQSFRGNIDTEDIALVATPSSRSARDELAGT